MTPSTPSRKPFNRILLTGAAGGLGQILRESLLAHAHIIRVSDISDMAASRGEHEEVVPCDLADKAGVLALAQDVDAIVHLGGISVERPFEEILAANISGTFHIYEAARKHGIKRVIFASSNHVTGFYPQDEKIDAQSPRRPDGYYGLSKSYGEDLATFYFHRYGIETVSLRIGSSFPEPRNLRMLSTWLSYPDLDRLVERALLTQDVGHTVVYGVSANRDLWWDNRYAAHLGFAPQDSSERFRSQVEQQPKPAADDPNATLQGGAFCAAGPFGD
ncbi:NAD-dependent dehydratase [Pseudomonas chlororaphis]|jgi:uronate dehydrogenase|uniref:NAD(P)-dependent oxidoreductase n=1 Tax=Pseudomonas morbosilactucae TaxID=2938197 RepID=A0A9X1YRT2_9PSED|nr:NAD(P)-dependent oxidoreductase [Pseudomonas morbosilactucae]MCK9797128.1 NAD(P)-dependent oxidoreductase [Pseudomonas morbosilactucae]MCK9813088.1 NAD(P)-dependent oxidoreductase [Pseudomonas morbosilactucae]ROL73700.1 NAD-dependent dehydratase [Pseudomonas chlororaphis]